MVSFRPKIGSWLALAALGLQLALSFGHVHLIGVHDAHDVTAVTGATVETYRFPAPGSAGDDYCAICASIQLAANSLVPQAAQVPTVSAFRTIEHADRVTPAVIAARRTAFQSRAPPLA